MTPFGSTAQMPDPRRLEARPAVARVAAFAAAGLELTTVRFTRQGVGILDVKGTLSTE